MSALPASGLLAPGQTVGNYRIVRQLGAGGMGAVYEAVHLQIERQAAIKVLFPHVSARPDTAARFLNEARAVNIIKHPNIVDVYEMGSLPDGSAFIVMEMLGGASLKDRLRWNGGRLGPAALRFARQIASALCAAHDKGITHRDLKPDNVMIVGDPELPAGERVKILDFGIAKLGAGTGSEGILGTPAYMSPEQCRGGDEVGPASDVYALGVILYQLLAGHPPFQGNNVHALLTAHLLDEPPPLLQIDPGLPPRLTGLVHSMLSKDPGARPTMGEIAAVLERMATVPLGQPAAVRSAAGLPAPLRFLGVGLAVVLLCGGGLWAARKLRARPLPVASSPPPAPPRQVRLSLQSDPAGAYVLRAEDGHLLGATPFSLEQKARTGSLRLLLRLPGYADRAVSLDEDTDADRLEHLQRLAPAAPAPPSLGPKHRHHHKRH